MKENINESPSIIVQNSESKKGVKQNRRSLKRNKRIQFHMTGKSVTFVGVNAAGITSKLHSFDKLLSDVKPTVWMMQETKRTNNHGKLTSSNLKNYQIFELGRQKSKEMGGKGLLGGGPGYWGNS